MDAGPRAAALPRSGPARGLRSGLRLGRCTRTAGGSSSPSSSTAVFKTAPAAQRGARLPGRPAAAAPASPSAADAAAKPAGAALAAMAYRGLGGAAATPQRRDIRRAPPRCNVSERQQVDAAQVDAVRSEAAAEPARSAHGRLHAKPPAPAAQPPGGGDGTTAADAANGLAERRAARQREQMTYQVSAIGATACMTFLAIMATFWRFQWHNHDSDIPWSEVYATLALVAGGVFGMEMWARWAHRVLWHDFEPGWVLHKSHHEPRVGPFEKNDIFAIVNGVPAMALCMFGFVTPGVLGGMCFGGGLGISLFGIAYMFVHDGLVHRRFPVGPLSQVPYMKRVAVAHQLHHSEKYGGVPWGLFLGPQEVAAIPGAGEELDRLVEGLDWSKR